MAGCIWATATIITLNSHRNRNLIKKQTIHPGHRTTSQLTAKVAGVIA